MDTSWYLDVNHFARHTGWLHSFMRAYASSIGVVLLGVAILAGWWLSRRYSSLAVAATVWAAAGTVAAVGLNQPLIHLVSRTRPYYVLKGVEVLVPRAHDFSFPSDHATAAGAVICGLALAGRRAVAVIAAVIGLLLAFARVYVGAHYPGDVAAGLAFGATVVAVLYPLAVRVILEPIVSGLRGTALSPLVASRSAAAR